VSAPLMVRTLRVMDRQRREVEQDSHHAGLPADRQEHATTAVPARKTRIIVGSWAHSNGERRSGPATSRASFPTSNPWSRSQ